VSRFSSLACLLLTLLIVSGDPCFGQGGPLLNGRIVDESGAAVAGAEVQLQDLHHKVTATTRSTASGDFAFSHVSPGHYAVFVSPFQGFAGQTVDALIQSASLQLQITLRPESAHADVQVDAGALSTDPAENRDAVVVSSATLTHLPVFDQNYIAALTPFLDASSISSAGVSIIVDGIEMKSTGVSPSAIQEIRINNDPYTAESNTPGRGRIEIMTKPGSPEFHGAFNFLFRDAALNASNYFAPGKPAEQRRIFEGHLSGPAGHGGHTTFLLSGARREEDLQASVHAATLAGIVDTNVPTPNRDTEVTFRVSRDLSGKHRISAQYRFEYDTAQNSNVGGLVLAEAGTNHQGREDDGLFNDRLILTPNLVNQLAVFFEKDEDVFSSVTKSPSLQVQGSFIGGGSQADLHNTETTIKINDIVSWNRGKHYLRFGINIPNLGRRAWDDATNRQGTFSFSSLNSFANATPYAFTAQQGPGRAIFWYNEFGAFIQDQITLNRKVQVSLGLRYDDQTYTDDFNNVSPRASIAYSPSGKSSTIIRAGVGVFYDRVGVGSIKSVKLNNGVALRAVQILNPSYPNPFSGGTSLSNLPTNLAIFSPALHSPYTVQYSFGVEQQISKGTTLAATYRGSTLVSKLRSRDANAPHDPASTVRPNPNLGFVQEFESGGRQLANGLDLTFRGRAGRWFSGQAQYTLAWAYNNTGGANFYPQNQYAPNDEWGPADFDRRHTFNLIGNLNPDHWLTLGIATKLYSGTPYTETTGADAYHTGLGNARPQGIARNTLRGSGTQDFDLLWSHDFHVGDQQAKEPKTLGFGISAFNVLNHPNFSAYVGNLSSTLFRQPTVAAASRQMQFELHYQF
jgi:hypothetical protein